MQYAAYDLRQIDEAIYGDFGIVQKGKLKKATHCFCGAVFYFLPVP